ncbi:MAG TPA: glycosyltransferase family 2 protein [Chitinophagaceae bacterium]|nr:glycosyltransferase family 2 protein [Chitinophagaceae bacterium]
MNQLRPARLNLSIVLPCYNPKPEWHLQVAAQYQQIKAALPADTLIEIIVVNDGSPNPVSAASRKFLSKKLPYFRFLGYSQNMGKGYAVRRGVEAAQAPIVIYTDIDFPYATEDLCAVYHRLKTGNTDLVMGVRESSYNSKLSFLRRLASNGCNYLNKTLLNLPYKDVQSGLKGMNAIGRELLLTTSINRFLFDTEFIWLASSYSNIRIEAITVRLRDNISFTSMSSAVYLKETGNFCRILLKDKLMLLRRFDAEFKTALPRTA